MGGTGYTLGLELGFRGYGQGLALGCRVMKINDARNVWESFWKFHVRKISFYIILRCILIGCKTSAHTPSISNFRVSNTFKFMTRIRFRVPDRVTDGIVFRIRIHYLLLISFQPVLHDWCNRGFGMYYPVCGMVHIKEPLLLIGKSSPCGGSGFPLSLSEWCFTICLMPYYMAYNRR